MSIRVPRLALLAIALAGAVPALAMDGGGHDVLQVADTTTNYYGDGGGYRGKSVQSGSVTNQYGENGGYRGRAVQSGGTTNYYSEGGGYRGRAVRSGNTTNYYGEGGGFKGSCTRGSDGRTSCVNENGGFIGSSAPM